MLALLFASFTVFFIWLLVRDLRSGRSRVSGLEVSRRKGPFLFWISIGSTAAFAGISVWMVLRLVTA
jgi:hypothetical protein